MTDYSDRFRTANIQQLQQVCAHLCEQTESYLRRSFPSGYYAERFREAIAAILSAPADTDEKPLPPVSTSLLESVLGPLTDEEPRVGGTLTAAELAAIASSEDDEPVATCKPDLQVQPNRVICSGDLVAGALRERLEAAERERDQHSAARLEFARDLSVLTEARGREVTSALGQNVAKRIANLEACLLQEEKAVTEALGERDARDELLDEMVESLGGIDVYGEHTSANDPWRRALDDLEPILPLRERAEQAERECAELKARTQAMVDMAAHEAAERAAAMFQEKLATYERDARAWEVIERYRQSIGDADVRVMFVTAQRSIGAPAIGAFSESGVGRLAAWCESQLKKESEASDG